VTKGTQRAAARRTHDMARATSQQAAAAAEEGGSGRNRHKNKQLQLQIKQLRRSTARMELAKAMIEGHGRDSPMAPWQHALLHAVLQDSIVCSGSATTHGSSASQVQEGGHVKCN
jgi:hypothetical protein